MMKRRLGVCILLMGALGILGDLPVSESRAESDPFPIYECIKPNVEFWKNVFTRYSREDCVIHDSRDVSVIFEVIRIKDWEKPGAWKTNRSLMKRGRDKYQKILRKLASGKSPSTQEERRVAALYGHNANRADFRRAMGRVRCQVGLKEQFRDGIIRSGAYLEEMRQILRTNGVPPDLAHLPHVESSFNPKAYSKFGASGVWQFTRSTGKRYMSVDYTVDERRDPIRSTHAAARFLKDNYETLRDWPMAITAYNHGVAGVLRAKRAKGTYEAIFKGYRSRTFKFASRNFYSEFLAARAVAKNHEEYFGKLELEKPRKRIEVVLDGYADIRDLAGYFEVAVPAIEALNPALREPVFHGQKYVPKGYALRLPPDTQLATRELPSHLYKAQQKKSRFHRVRRGDTAGKIARMYRIELSDLISANNLNSKAVIRTGQYLRLPAPEERLGRVTVSKTPTKILAESSIEVPGKSPKMAPSKPPMMAASMSPMKKEKKTLTTEAPTKPQPKTDSEMKREEPSEIQINPTIVTGHLQVEKAVTLAGKRMGFIRVEAEETLGHYADWLRIETREIRRLNGFKPGKVIRIHERLKIPLDKVSQEEFEEKRFEYHKEIEEDFFASYAIESIKTYKIRNGDNVWKLCQEVFEVPFWLVKKYNPTLDFSRLKPLQEMLVPEVERNA